MNAARSFRLLSLLIGLSIANCASVSYYTFGGLVFLGAPSWASSSSSTTLSALLSLSSVRIWACCCQALALWLKIIIAVIIHSQLHSLRNTHKQTGTHRSCGRSVEVEAETEGAELSCQGTAAIAWPPVRQRVTS